MVGPHDSPPQVAQETSKHVPWQLMQVLQSVQVTQVPLQLQIFEVSTGGVGCGTGCWIRPCTVPIPREAAAVSKLSTTSASRSIFSLRIFGPWGKVRTAPREGRGAGGVHAHCVRHIVTWHESQVGCGVQLSIHE